MLRKSKEYSQRYRDSEEEKIKQDIRTYELFNSMCNVYPLQKWHTDFFTQDDEPLVGNRKEKNKISAKNSRKRKKNMKKELGRRIHQLEIQLQPKFTFNFIF